MATKVKLIADGVITPDQITLTTASTGTNTTAPATTAFVQQEISALVDSSPDALNTLNELAAALGDDANFSTTVTNSIATKLPLAGGTMTGTLTVADIASSGYLQLTANDVDFIVRDTTDSPTNFIWRDHSGSKLYLGSPAAEVTIRSDAIIDTGYKIGIGTTSPSADLHISKTSGGAVLKVDTSATADAGIQIKGYDAYVALGDDTNGLQWYVWNDGPSASSSLKFGSQALSASDWYADASQAMVITSSGNVGIGTTSPAKKLEIFGSGSENGILVKNDTNTNYRGYYISSVESDNTAYGKFHMDVNSGELNITSGYSGWGGYITFNTNGSQRMSITSSDITLKPGNGTVIVDGGTADYEPAKVELQGRAFGGDITAKYEVSDGGAVFFGSTTNHSVRFITNNTPRWIMGSGGHITPNNQHTYDIGGTNAEVRNIYAQGISFASNANASGMTSELLDDYEEGTFTLSVSNGTLSYLYSSVSTYTKIGNRVFIDFGQLQITGTNTGSSALVLTGLPFTTTNQSSGVIGFINMPYGTSAPDLVGNFYIESNLIYFGARRGDYLLRNTDFNGQSVAFSASAVYKTTQ